MVGFISSVLTYVEKFKSVCIFCDKCTVKTNIQKTIEIFRNLDLIEHDFELTIIFLASIVFDRTKFEGVD